MNHKASARVSRLVPRLLALLGATVAALPGPAPAAICPPTSVNHTDSFTSTTTQDTTSADNATAVDGWGDGDITHRKKERITERITGELGKRVFSIAIANWDRDVVGYEDIIGLVRTVNEPKSGGSFPADRCAFELFKNKGVDVNGDHLGFEPGVVLKLHSGADMETTSCFAQTSVLKAGDVDGDGAPDLMFFSMSDMHAAGTLRRSAPGHAYVDYRFYVYRNCPTQGSASAGSGSGNCPAATRVAGDAPVFATLQGTVGKDEPMDTIYIRSHWAPGAFQLVQWNDDSGTDRADLLFATGYSNTSRVVLYYACNASPTGGPGGCSDSMDFANAYNLGWNWKDSTQAGSPKRAILLSTTAVATPIADTGSAITMPSTSCSPTRKRGPTTLVADDFDGDGDFDLILGSMTEYNLFYYENTGTNASPTFGSSTTITFDKGGPAYLEALDINGDGRPGLLVATDRYGCNGSNGKLWSLTNSGGVFGDPTEVIDMGPDVDWLSKLDADGDGFRDDAIVGRNVRGSPYGLIISEPTSVFLTDAEAVSASITDALDATTSSVVSVAVTSLTVSGPATGITLYVSNDDGRNWELITAEQEPSSLGGTSVVHEFRNHGARLRWKLASHNEDTLTGAQASLAPGATTVPVIGEIKLTYKTVNEAYRLSQSGLSYGSFTDGASLREFVYTAYTNYPDNTAELVATEITGCSLVPGKLFSQGCATGGWGYTLGDGKGAGDILEQLTDGATRTMFTSRSGGTISVPLGVPLSANAQTALATTDDNDYLFVRDGMTLAPNQHPKLYDVGHSSPVFVGAPVSVSASCLDPFDDDDFDDFASSQAGRDPVVYLGTNDGALHAFNADDGTEKWAYVPQNLAGRLKEQRATDDVYQHGLYVDAPPVVKDVFDGSNWRTILIGGEGRGVGSSGNNYYYAIDITDPDNPDPLWEFTDPWDQNGGSCDGNPCSWTCTLSCPAESCSKSCGVVRSTLSAAVSSGNSTITINSTDWASFPSSGRIQIERNDPSDIERFYYTKGATGVLNLKTSTGAVATAAAGHSVGQEVMYVADYIFAEDGNIVVIEAENYQQEETQASHYWWTRQVASGYSGFGHLDPLTTSGADSGINCDDDYTGCGAEARFTVRFDTTRTWDVYFRVRYPSTSDDSVSWGFDGTHLQELVKGTGSTAWVWSESISGGTNSDPVTRRIDVTEPGLHVFNLWMREDSSAVDKIVLVPQGTGTPSSAASETCEDQCVPSACTETCTETCVAQPDQDDWPECGVGKKCCDVAGNSTLHFCADTGEDCLSPESVLGETWSPPNVGKFKVGGFDRWLVIFGSGYNNRGHVNVGRSIYAVDALTGALVGVWDLDDVATSVDNPSTIDNTVPGGVTLVETDACGATPEAGCGYVNRIYVGDLEGRLWKIDTEANGVLNAGLLDTDVWPKCVVFDAGDPDGDGTREWAPIITKPGVAVLVSDTVNVYFGTGGDDRTDSATRYRFYAIRDKEAGGTAACDTPTLELADLGIAEGEWIIGDDRMNDGNPVTAGTPFAAAGKPVDYEGAADTRYWSDPIIIKNRIIVFSSLEGKIDALNPCDNITGGSVVYGYALTRFRTAAGSVKRPGERVAELAVASKVRQPAVARGVMGGLGFNVYGSCQMASETTPIYDPGPEPEPPLMVSDAPSAGDAHVLPTDFNPQTTDVGLFKILRWREIPL